MNVETENLLLKKKEKSFLSRVRVSALGCCYFVSLFDSTEHKNFYHFHFFIFFFNSPGLMRRRRRRRIIGRRRNDKRVSRSLSAKGRAVLSSNLLRQSNGLSTVNNSAPFASFFASFFASLSLSHSGGRLIASSRSRLDLYYGSTPSRACVQVSYMQLRRRYTSHNNNNNSEKTKQRKRRRRNEKNVS